MLYLLIVFGVLAAGCASTQQFRVSADSLARPDSVARKSYVLLPGNKGTGADDLQFQEYATYVQRALAARGLVHATRLEDADIAVFLSYGIGDPQTHYYTYSLPIWGQTGYSGSTTSGALNTFGGYGTYSGTTTYTPTYGVTGYSNQLSSATTYFRFILLDAYDMESYKQEKWRPTPRVPRHARGIRKISRHKHRTKDRDWSRRRERCRPVHQRPAPASIGVSVGLGETESGSS
jgi:hypothetical protein